jgi:UDP-GlcNAc:undecaprenyl-phosphate GlcNAc-1-phosphate transferase
MTYLSQALLAFFCTALLIMMMRRPAERFGLVDHPGGRKRHAGVVPLTGGIAMVAGFLVALAVSYGAFNRFAALFAGFLMLALIGLLDDLGEVSAGTKMLFQVIAAVLMTSWANVFLSNLGNLFGRGPLLTHNWAIPLTVFATLAVINAVNMFDGLDGLAGSLALVTLGYFAMFANYVGDANSLKLLLVLCGALVGFLIFNWPHPLRGRRRTFMGDAGSLVLGYAIAWFSVYLTQQEDFPSVPPVIMLWVVGVFLFDVFTVTIRRLVRRRSPMAPDRDHLHHMLLRRGFSPRVTLLLIVTAQLVLAAVGTALWRLQVAEHIVLLAYVGIGVVYFAAFFLPPRLMRRLRRINDAAAAPKPD